MATTSADIAVNSNNYHGDPNLGGGNLGIIKIDTKPLADLADYTFKYNQKMYEAQQAKVEKTAKELADFAGYDLQSAIPGDREKIQEQYNTVFNYLKDDPTVMDYQANPKGWLAYQKMKNGLDNNLAGAKVRSILYVTRQNEASADTRPGMKDYLQGKLDEEANSTDLMQPLKNTELFDIAPVTTKAPGEKEFDLTSIGANYYGTRTFKVWDQKGLNEQAAQLGLGFSDVDENSEAFKNKTKTQKDEYYAQKASGKLEPVESAKNISTVLQQDKYKAPAFRNQDGSLNIDAVIKDQAGNGTVSGVLTTIKQYNDRMHEMKTGIKSGYFQDKLGGQLSFGGGGGLNENDYSDIDLTDGISAEEIIKPRILAMTNPIGYTTKTVSTNTAIDQQNANTARGHLNEQIRNDNMDDKRIRDLAKLPYDKAKEAADAAALEGKQEFGNILYLVRSKPDQMIRIDKADGTKIPNVVIKNGIVTDQKGNVVKYTGDILVPGDFLDANIVTQFNKYQGTGKLNPDGTTAVNPTPSRLLFNKDGKVTLRMVDGVIEGIQTGTETETIEGTDKIKGLVPGPFAGVNQFQDITQKAAVQGVTKAKPANIELGKLTQGQKFLNKHTPAK